MIIIHGDNTILSRQELHKHMDEARTMGKQLIRLDGATVSPSDVEMNLGAMTFFGDEKVIIIEQLWSQRSVTKKNAVQNILINAQLPIILWQNKTLTATQLKPFASSKPDIRVFKSSKATYSLIEKIGISDKVALITSLQKSCQEDTPEFVFIMCMRQMRMLLQLVCGLQPAGAPFAIQKAKSQVKRFNLESLLKLHQEFVQMDRLLKTSQNVLSTEQFLTVTLLRM